ncbi:MAG: M23 family metallopeptidase [Polyangiaceae bacterium]|nr:M23 family metallopeptidase [Polyangiaceae bacterium]
MADKDGGVDFVDPGIHGAKEKKHEPPHHHRDDRRADDHDEDVVADDKGDVVFPLFRRPLADFHTGGRSFGSGRAGGRLHAAVDLLAPFKAPIRAIADGRVIQPPYFFYLGSNALEIDHGDIGVVRYGEISQVKTVRVHTGQRVKKGEVIAYVGLLDTGSSMLHFELYKGNRSGALTVVSNPPYQRRSDLRNPTKLIERLLRKAF